jgi:hypothetical protein
VRFSSRKNTLRYACNCNEYLTISKKERQPMTRIFLFFIATALLPRIAFGQGVRSRTDTFLNIVGRASGTATRSRLPIFVQGYTDPLNLINVTADTVDASALRLGGATTAVDSLTVNHRFGGPGTRGSRNGIGVNLELTAPTANAGEKPYNSYYNGILASVRGDTGDGGTARAQKGDLYGLSAQMTLASGAKYWAGIHGGEWDIDVFPGASVTNKTGIEISLGPHDAVAGTNLDNAILLSNNSPHSPGWKYGIAFGVPKGQGFWPIAATGALIGTYYTGTAANGIDLHRIAFSGCAFKSRNLCIDGNGHIMFSQPRGPLVSCTGTGTGGSCNLTAGGPSADSAGMVEIVTGRSPAASGFVTIAFAKPVGAHSAVCSFMQKNGVSAWPVPTNFAIASESTSAVRLTWNSGAVRLAGSTTYAIDYICVGR